MGQLAQQVYVYYGGMYSQTKTTKSKEFALVKQKISDIHEKEEPPL